MKLESSLDIYEDFCIMQMGKSASRKTSKARVQELLQISLHNRRKARLQQVCLVGLFNNTVSR